MTATAKTDRHVVTDGHVTRRPPPRRQPAPPPRIGLTWAHATGPLSCSSTSSQYIVAIRGVQYNIRDPNKEHMLSCSDAHNGCTCMREQT
eukprot:7380118-Prymnesium_polylepis.1